MPAVIVRNLSEEIHRALKLRATRHGRSTEAEIRSILEEAVKPKAPVRIGSRLTAFAKKEKISLNLERDKTPIKPAEFE